MKFDPQKVLDIHNVKHVDKLKWPMWYSHKVDGVYCAAIRTFNKLKILSRTGKEYTSLEHLKGYLLDLMEASKCDVILFEAASMFPLSFPYVVGKIRSTKEQADFVCAFVHDALTLDEFYEGTGRTFKERFGQLAIFADLMPSHFLFLKQFPVGSLEEAEQIADEYIDAGGEGIVLRDPNALYRPGKRDNSMIKIKRGLSYDLKVLSIEEGTGKNKGRVGKLVCQWKDGKTIKVGSGLTDEQRQWWWLNYDEVIGKIVEVTAMEESSKGLLRQPIFKGIRHDKKRGDF